jgi:DNA-3-methyladenine glycosylase II
MPFSAQHIKAARLSLQKKDPTMKKILKRVGPFTASTRRDRFGTLVRSIVSQQISTAAAKTILGRLEDLLAGKKKKSGTTGSVFDPKILARCSPEALRKVGVSKQKGGYVLDLSAKVHSGEVDLKSIHRLDDEQAIEELTKVKGIGRWTAQMFLMFSLGRLDVFPVDDLGIKNAIKKEYGFREPPERDEMEELAKAWRPYATVASWYLWRTLELDD